MKAIFLFYLGFLGLCPLLGHSQTPTFEWALHGEGTDVSQGYTTKIDPQGNTYTLGKFRGTVDFDPGQGSFDLTAAGLRDHFLLKLDPAGQFVYVRSWNDTLSSQNLDLAVNGSGEVYITGSLFGSVDFDPGMGSFVLTSSSFGTDLFLLKLDSQGDFLWVRTIEGQQTRGKSIDLDTSQNVVLGGEFLGTIDVDPGTGVTQMTSNGNFDLFVAKLTPNADLIWASNMGGQYSDDLNHLTVSDANEVLVAGMFWLAADFDPGPGTQTLTSNAEDGFVLQLDASGQLNWVAPLAVSADLRITGLSTDALSNTFLSGYFSDTMDLDIGSSTQYAISKGGTDGFLIGLDQTGGFVWGHQIGGIKDDRINDLVSVENGTLFATGAFLDSVDFDPGIGSSIFQGGGSQGSRNAFLLQMDANGSFKWAGEFNNNLSFSDGLGIAVDAAHQVYTTGEFRLDCDFDPSSGTAILNAPNNGEFFVQKMQFPFQSNSTFSVSECGPYTVPSGDSTYLSSGTYMDTIPNASGGDSVLTILLTITALDTSLNLAGTTLSSNAMGATFQWLQCTSSGFVPVAGANGPSFTPSQNGSYAVALDQNNCQDTSACNAVIVVGLEGQTQRGFSLSPNPNRGNFQVQFHEFQSEFKIEINDALGKKVYAQKFHNCTAMELNPGLSQGVYFLAVTDQNGLSSVKKLVVE